MTTVKQILLDSTKILSETSPSARLDVELLLQFVLNKSRTYLYSYPEKNLNELEYKLFLALLQQRSQGKPIAYITNKKEFWSLELEVTKDTLIPRADTEILVEVALEAIKDLNQPIIFDLGTGSGAIAIAIASERVDAKIYASDECQKTLKVAQRNIYNHQIKNIELIHSNWFDKFPRLEADLIISNPPYIDYSCPHIEAMVEKYEPAQALFSDDNGYKDLLTIIEQSKYHLRRHGILLLEHGINQELILHKALAEKGYTSIENHTDLQNINRCIQAVK